MITQVTRLRRVGAVAKPPGGKTKAPGVFSLRQRPGRATGAIPISEHPLISQILFFSSRPRRRVGTPLGFKMRKCYQSKQARASNFAMDDTSKKSEPAVRRVVWGRQFLASTVVVPPDVAEHLNTDAMAVLAVIRNEAQASGKCSLPLARIAERANIGRAKARAAIRLAEGLGLIAIEETPDRKRVIVNRGVTSRC